jgi:HK97 family phage prohead protease
MAAVYYDPGRPDETQYALRSNIFERIERGVFDGLLGEDADILALQDHDPALFLGRRSSGTLTVTLTPAGMAYEIKTPRTRVGEDTLALIERRDISGSSFQMYKPKAVWSHEMAGTEKRYVRTVNQIESIVDLGPVLQPAYLGTSANVGKRCCGFTRLSRSAGPPEELTQIEAELAEFVNANWHQSEAQLRLQQMDILRA